MDPIARPNGWYTARYCEENIWRLASDPAVRTLERYAVFISNARKTVPIWRQSSSENPEEQPVLWDYHVVMLARMGGFMVLDFDTTLGFATPVRTYLTSSFPMQDVMKPEFKPRFRVIPVEEFLATFASDRSHMRDGDGWHAPPPPFPCIATARASMNLWDFVDMTQAFVGEVLDYDGMLARFA